MRNMHIMIKYNYNYNLKQISLDLIEDIMGRF